MASHVCNSTLDDLRILPTSEQIIVSNMTFHTLSLFIAACCTGVAILISLFLIFMHALHYTKPREQKHIIRILFMVPVYAVASFLSLKFYWHAIYYQVLSSCYEAFAISSFFALICHYVAPSLHEQKDYFRGMSPIIHWVWPVSWFAACCGGGRGPWRTPRNGLTWFNIIWVCVYQYCFIRVACTVIAVITQHTGVYCESSNAPYFAHIWLIVIDAIAVSITMYCIIQSYIQLRTPLAQHRVFAKVLSIKLVIFLSFWQTIAISIGTSSSVHILAPNSTLAYPDIKVGIPSLLLCVEMALFAFLHLWAFPYHPYMENAQPAYYPVPNPKAPNAPQPRENLCGPRQGGFLGFRAIWEAVYIWDIFGAFGRGMCWLMFGVRQRHQDASYTLATKPNRTTSVSGDTSYGTPYGPSSYGSELESGYHGYDSHVYDPSHGSHNADSGKFGSPTLPDAQSELAAVSTEGLPIASEFRRSNLGLPPLTQPRDAYSPYSPASLSTADMRHSQIAEAEGHQIGDERVGLISHVQANPTSFTRYEDEGSTRGVAGLRNDALQPHNYSNSSGGYSQSSSPEAKQMQGRMSPQAR